MHWSRYQVSGPMGKGKTSQLPNDCGVYGLFAKGKLWYVGETIHLSERFHHGIHKIRILFDHFSDVEVAFRPTSGKPEARRLEARLIKKLDPPPNGGFDPSIFPLGDY
jgi:excinuclease UvrABC nuclease subunit